MSAVLPDADVRLQLARGSAFAALFEAAEANDSELHELLSLVDLAARRKASGESLLPWVELIEAERRCVR